MTDAKTRYLSLLIVLIVVASHAVGQVPTGIPPFGSFGGGPFDVVNLANLNVHMEFPVMSKAGRGVPFVYRVPYDSSVWYPAGVTGSQTWTPVTNYGWPAVQQVATGTPVYSTFTTNCFDPDLGHVILTHYHYTAYIDGSGISHPFDLYVTDQDLCAGTTGGTQLSKDGSGYTLNADADSSYVTTRTGWGIYPASKISDSNGNYISVSGGVFTDTLGTAAMTVTGTGTATSPLKFAYPNPGGTSSYVTLNYTNFNIKTNFGCSGIGDVQPASPVPLVTSVVMPDSTSYTITYETTPGFSTYVTGRIASIVLPTGGEIDYQYTGANNGIVCADGSAAGLKRTLTPGGVWNYSRTNVSGTEWQTTVTDPASNDTQFTFQGLYETRRQNFQGSVAGGSTMQTLISCYNSNLTSCDTTAIVLPIVRKTVTIQLPGGKQSEVDTTYDSTGYGLVKEVDEYDFGNGAPPSTLTRKTVVTYANLGNGLVDHPTLINVENSSNALSSSTQILYDEGTPTSTTGTPNHSVVAGSRGNPTTITSYFSITGSLSRHLTYYDTGTVNTSTDVNGAVTTYIYGSGTSCGNSFPTEVDLPLSLKEYFTWDSTACTGAVMKTAKDVNGNTTTYTYGDANYWRVTKVTDPLTNNTTISYPDTKTVESTLTFGSTTIDVRSATDGFGRPHLVQQLSSGSNYNSVETDYDSVGRASKTMLPFSSTAGSTCSGTCPGTSYSYDALGHPILISDAGGGDISNNFAPGTISYDNDVLTALEPAPTGESTKKRQMESDGLGRVTSVCEVTGSTGSGSCVQSASQTGLFTQYTLNLQNQITAVSQSAQSTHPQGRTFAYDLLGRLTSETNPETGTTQYFYDTAPSSPGVACSGTYNGDLVKRYDAEGDTTCYTYDALHRVTSTTYSGPYSSATPTKTFIYDSATVNGVAMTNAKGHLAEAYTGPSSPKTTDLGFSYSVRGELTDVYQSSTHSGGYYHVTAAYFASGALNKIQNLVGLPTITYALDSVGRPQTVSASTGTNPVSNTVYNTASQVTEVDLGSSDKDTFQYDSNTGRMTEYKFAVGTSSTVKGDLTWNANGTLGQLVITDGFNSPDAQTCTYGYDDMSRVTSASCGSAWSQTFSFDPFGNIAKTGSSAFNAGYLLTDGTTNNRIQTLSGVTPSYDSNGNLTSDGTHTYAWDAEARPVQIDSSTVIYDALGRMVEGGTNTEMVYSPGGGKLATMNGQTLLKAFVPLPGGGSVVYNSAGILYYRHPDWLGSSRFASTPSRTKYFDAAYAPYGESYVASGTTDLSYTGQNQDAVAGHYDFLFREYNPVHGRWISPDPAGLAVVNAANPQSWNRYEYVLNKPTGLIDNLGLNPWSIFVGISQLIGGSFSVVTATFPTDISGFEYNDPIFDSQRRLRRDDGKGEGASGGSPYSTGCVVAATCYTTPRTHGFKHCTITVGQNGEYTDYDGEPTGNIFNSTLVVTPTEGSSPGGPNTVYLSDSCAMASCVPAVAQQINDANMWYSFPFQNSNTAAGMMLHQCGASANVTLPVTGPQ